MHTAFFLLHPGDEHPLATDLDRAVGALENAALVGEFQASSILRAVSGIRASERETCSIIKQKLVAAAKKDAAEDHHQAVAHSEQGMRILNKILVNTANARLCRKAEGTGTPERIRVFKRFEIVHKTSAAFEQHPRLCQTPMNRKGPSSITVQVKDCDILEVRTR